MNKAEAFNLFLSDNFAPVSEEVSVPCTQLIGNLPEDIKGYFLRIGPNPQFAPPDAGKYHWFDGDGMIHQVHVSQGQASYRNRWVRTKGFELERQAGKGIWKGFQSLHELEQHHGMMTKNVANTAMVYFTKRLLALWEAGPPHSLGLDDLQTHGEYSFDEQWPYALSAHPKLCPVTGELLAFAYQVMGDYGFSYGVFNQEGKLIHQANIPLKGKHVMIHDCAITRDYTLILDLPVTFSLERAMSGGAAFAWEADNGARIGVLPRYGNAEDVRWFPVANGYIFHVINAWQEGDAVILEACRSNCSSVISDIDANSAFTPDDELARPHRYRLDLASGVCEESAISELACEFPRINEQFVGKANRYAYASLFSPASVTPRFNGVVKFDREAAYEESYYFPEGVYGGEFVFVPREQGEAEDDGYLMGFVHDEKQQQSELYILDAKAIVRGPVSHIQFEQRIPYGFHAAWVAEA